MFSRVANHVGVPDRPYGCRAEQRQRMLPNVRDDRHRRIPDRMVRLGQSLAQVGVVEPDRMESFVEGAYRLKHLASHEERRADWLLDSPRYGRVEAGDDPARR